jgi:hypothetical protein
MTTQSYRYKAFITEREPSMTQTRVGTQYTKGRSQNLFGGLFALFFALLDRRGKNMFPRISSTGLQLLLMAAVLVLSGTTARTSYAQSGILQCELDYTGAVQQCYAQGGPRSVVKKCIDAAQARNSLCTLGAGGGQGRSEELDVCGLARAGASQCLAAYQACGGFSVEGCAETYEACKLASGIDRCQ